MRLTPKKTSYDLKFRIKLQTKKVLKRAARLRSQPTKPRIHFFKPVCWHKLGGFADAGLKSNVHQNAWLVQDFELACRKSASSYADGFALKSPSYGYKTSLLFGTYGLMSTHYGKLRSKCVSTLILECAKALKKKSKIHLRICCDTPVTARPVETRMGKGKGSLSYWEAKAKAGTVLFEFGGLNQTKAYELLKLLGKKTHLDLKLIC